jgi:uncharacterized protein (TIGR03067 family)
MRVTTLLFCVAASLPLAAQPANPDANKDDAAKLQGTWSIISVEIDGKALAMDKLKDARLAIHGTQYSFALEKTRLELAFNLDATKSPKAIDLRVMDGPDKGKVYHGIYKLEKGQYTICRTTEPGKDRPTAFATRADSGLMIVVWKRK